VSSKRSLKGQIERRLKAVTLKMRGETLANIGKALDCDSSKACQLIREGLAVSDDVAEVKTKGQELRLLQTEQLNACLRSLWGDSELPPPDPKTITAIIKLLERVAKLWGLDEAEKVDVAWTVQILRGTTPERVFGAPLEEIVNRANGNGTTSAGQP